VIWNKRINNSYLKMLWNWVKSFCKSLISHFIFNSDVGSPVLGDHNTGVLVLCTILVLQCSYPTHIKILVEWGIDNTSSNISTIPITILTTILYTSKIYICLNHNTGIQYWNKFLYQYCGIPVGSIVIAKYRRSFIFISFYSEAYSRKDWHEIINVFSYLVNKNNYFLRRHL
jgi:hypothetical protein